MRHGDFAPQAIMLIGVPGSGKSTYIKQLMARNPDRNYVVLSTDDIFELWGKQKGWDYNKAFQNIPFKKVQHEFDKKFMDAIKNKRDIIIDQTNLTTKSRSRKLTQIPDGYEKIGVVFKTDPEEVKRRLEKRAAETGKSIPDNVLKKMTSSFEMPTKNEFDKIEVIN